MQEIREHEAKLDRIRSLAMDPRNVEAGADPGYHPSESAPPAAPFGPFTSRSQVETQALRAVEQAGRLMAPRAQDRLDAVIRDTANDPMGIGPAYIAAVSDRSYENAFFKIAEDPNTAAWRMTPDEHRAVQAVQRVESIRAMSLTGSAGGFAVPFTLDPTLIGTSNGVVNPFRQICRTVTIATDTWRGVSSGAITASYTAEATETTDNSPTLAQPEISTEKAQAFVPFSIEIGMDWGTLQQELGGLLAEAKDALEASKFTSGTGTNEPFGLITGATNTVNATTGQTVDAEDVYRLETALPPRHRPFGVFMGSGTILNTLYRLVGGGSTEPPLVNEDRTRLLGRPFVENSEMATVTTTGTKFLAYFNPNRFVIVDRIGLQVELIPHLMGANRRPTGERGLYMYFRNSSKLIDANAARVLIGIA